MIWGGHLLAGKKDVNLTFKIYFILALPHWLLLYIFFGS
jgi:hypothetical protein